MPLAYILIAIVAVIEIIEAGILVYLIRHNRVETPIAKKPAAVFTVKQYDVTSSADLAELRQVFADNIWFWHMSGKDVDEIAEMIYNNVPNPCVCCNSYANNIGGCNYTGKGTCKETGIREFVEQVIAEAENEVTEDA